MFHCDLMDLYTRLYRMDKYFIDQDVSDHHFSREKLSLKDHVYPVFHKFNPDDHRGVNSKKRLVVLLRLNDEQNMVKECLKMEKKCISNSRHVGHEKAESNGIWNAHQVLESCMNVPLEHMSYESEHSFYVQSRLLARHERGAETGDEEYAEEEGYDDTNEKKHFGNHRYESEQSQVEGMDEYRLRMFDDLHDVAREDYSVTTAASTSDWTQFVGWKQSPNQLTARINRLYQCWVQKWLDVLTNNPEYATFVSQYDLHHVNVVLIGNRFNSRNYLRMANGSLIRRAIYAKWLSHQLIPVSGL